MSLALTIAISVVASVIGGVISGLFVMRKVTYDTKRLYARQMCYSFADMSGLVFLKAVEYLESLGYSAEGVKEYSLSTYPKEELALVRQIRKDHEQSDDRKLEVYDTQELINRVNDLVKYTIDESGRLKNFINTYLPQSTYFDGLCEASSISESIKFWQNEIIRSVNDKDIRTYVSAVTFELLRLLDALLNAGAEILYYSYVKSWTWRLLLPRIRN